MANKSIRAYEPSFETQTEIIVQLIPCYQDQNLLLLRPPGFGCFLTEHPPRSLRSDDKKKLQNHQSGKTFLNRKIKSIKINLQAVSPYEYALHKFTLDNKFYHQHPCV